MAASDPTLVALSHFLQQSRRPKPHKRWEQGQQGAVAEELESGVSAPLLPLALTRVDNCALANITSEPACGSRDLAEYIRVDQRAQEQMLVQVAEMQDQLSS